MALYTKDSLETLRQRISLIDVLESHLDLKKMGASYKALCPFHDEKSPSFVVQKGDSHYHCFGCGAHGDAIQFLMTHQRLSFSDAVELLAQKFQVALELVEKEERSGSSKGALKESLHLAALFFHMMLLHTPEGHQALDYLYSRGLSLSFIQKFQLGLAPKQSMLRRTLHSKFIKDETMLEAGLLANGKDGSYRDFFYDRITIPIRDATGAVIGFSARKYKEETFGGKYVNTSETPLFKKSRILFGLNYCRRRIAKERKVLVVEGQLDALRLIDAGFNITVAGQGTAFGEGHVKELMALGINLVYLAFDSDNAGQEAIAKVGHLFQREGIEVIVVKLPLGDDPDSFLRAHGSDAFLKLMESGMDYLTFLVAHHSRTIDTRSPAGKNELVGLISSQIKEWGQQVMVHESLRKLAHLVQVPEELIGSHEVAPNFYAKKSPAIGRFSVDPDRIIEGDVVVWLLSMAGIHPQYFRLVEANVKREDFKSDPARTVYEALLSLYKAGEKWDFFQLMSVVQEEAAQHLIQELLQKKINREKSEEFLVAALQKMIDRNWMQKRELIKMKIQAGECSDDEAWELLKVFDELKRSPPKVVIPS